MLSRLYATPIQCGFFGPLRPLAAMLKFVCVSMACASINLAAAQSNDTVRHTVIKGDTLWDISEQYLDSPWLWPEIWEQNKAISNPDLIYPNDVLLISPSSIRLIRNTKLRVEKKSPEIREIPLEQAITTIDPSVITPFLTQSVILDDDRLQRAGHVIQGTRGEIILGKGTEFFASGLSEDVDQRYELFEIGRPIIDVKTQQNYGIEGVHLGRATLLATGEVARLVVTQSNQEIRPGDRITPISTPTALPRYFPHKPATPIDTYITMIPRGLSEAGRRDIVVIVGGKDQGLEPGHVLLINADSGKVKDPVSGELVQLPPLEVGAMMVFQVFNQVSYAVIMNSADSIKIGDQVVSP